MNAAVGDTRVLFRLRLRIFSRLMLSRFTAEAQRAAPFRLAALLLFGGISLLLFGLGIGRILAFSFQGQPARPLLLPALIWSPAAAAVGIFFYAVLSLAAAFTYRNDLSLLMLAPVSPRLVLADKLLAISSGFSVLLLFIGLPDLIGVGQALHAGLEFDLAAAVLIAVVPIPSTALALLLTIAVLHTIPPARVRTVSAVAATIIAAALYGISQTLAGLSVDGVFGRWSVVPTTWPGQALVSLADAQPGKAAVYLTAAVLFAAAMGAFAVDRAARLLASGWTVYGEVGRRRLPAVSWRRRGRRHVYPAWWPVLRKEWLVMRRDPKLLAQLAYPLLLEGYSFYNAFGNPLTAHPIAGKLTRFVAGSLYLTGSMTALFLLSLLALPIVGREGRSLYLLALVPARALYLLLAKLIFCIVPVLALTEVLLLTVAVRLLRLSPSEAVFVAAAMAALVSALGCWLVCVGLMWPRFASDGSRRQVHGTALVVGPTSGGMLCAVVGLLFTTVFSAHADSSSALVAGGGIFLLTGCIIAGVLVVGPRLFHDLLVGDRRPA